MWKAILLRHSSHRWNRAISSSLSTIVSGATMRVVFDSLESFGGLNHAPKC